MTTACQENSAIDMEIFSAGIHDASILTDIHNSSFNEMWSQNDFIERMGKNSIWKFFIAKENGECVGYLSSYFIIDEASIVDIAVLEKHRKTGYGSAILSYFIDFCKSADIKKIMLEVRKSNTVAIALYKKYGFEVVGTSKNHYEHPVEDALLMNKGL